MFDDGLGVGEAIIGVFGDESFNDGGDAEIDIAAEFIDWGGDFLEVGEGDFDRFAFEHGTSHEEEVGGSAEAIEIGAMVDVIGVFNLFGGHEFDRTEELSAFALGANFFGELCQAEVEDFEGPLLGEDEVTGFDVSVDDPLIVGIGESGGGLGEELDDFVLGGGTLKVEAMGEGDPFDEFHDQVMDGLELTGVESGHDIGVHEFGDGADFGVEAVDEFRVLGEAFGEDFDSDFALHGAMDSAEDVSHSAGADLFAHEVFAEDGFQIEVGAREIAIVGWIGGIMDFEIGLFEGMGGAVEGMEAGSVGGAEFARRWILRRLGHGEGLASNGSGTGLHHHSPSAVGESMDDLHRSEGFMN